MTRKITADEVRRFFETVNGEFEQSGFLLNGVRFHRDGDQKCTHITLNYTVRTDDEQHSDISLSETQTDSHTV